MYPESEDGGYCKFCVLFAECDSKVKELGILVSRPFSSVLEDHSLSIDTQLISDQEKWIRENRLKIRCIAETVIFCGRQGIAMRGHRDDGPAVQDNTCANHGNFFLALLKFRIQAGDTMLQDHLLKSAGNALYTSKTIQN